MVLQKKLGHSIVTDNVVYVMKTILLGWIQLQWGKVIRSSNHSFSFILDDFNATNNVRSFTDDASNESNANNDDA